MKLSHKKFMINAIKCFAHVKEYSGVHLFLIYGFKDNVGYLYNGCLSGVPLLIAALLRCKASVRSVK